MHPLIQQISRCIEREQLASKEQLIYVAVSGGADSVALLTALLSLGYRLQVLHCNFHLRGEESDRDAEFVQQLCIRLQIPYEIKHFSTLEYAKKQGISIEMAARDLRYDWFRRVWECDPNCRIAIAHNSNDVAETFLYNLSQGTGIRGLAGIPYKRKGGIIRPLLDCSKEDVLDYLQTSPLVLGYCEDSSNSDIQYRRNYIRHRLLPCFEGLKAGASKQIYTSIKQLRGAEAFYRDSIERYKNLVLRPKGISIEQLQKSPDTLTLLFEILKDYGFTSNQCYQIAEHLSNMPLGATYQSERYRLVHSWGYLELRPLKYEPITPIYIRAEHLPYSISTPYGTIIVSTTSKVILNDVLCLSLPITKLGTHPLCLRSPSLGERMKPFGMNGRKRLSRILIDAKASHREREEALVLSQGDEVLWLVGFAKSESTRLKQEELQTEQIFLSIKFTPTTEQND